MSSAALENLETQLEMFIENVRQIRIIVSDFQPQGQSVLNQKMYVFLFVCLFTNTLIQLANSIRDLFQTIARDRTAGSGQIEVASS